MQQGTALKEFQQALVMLQAAESRVQPSEAAGRFTAVRQHHRIGSAREWRMVKTLGDCLLRPLLMMGASIEGTRWMSRLLQLATRHAQGMLWQLLYSTAFMKRLCWRAEKGCDQGTARRQLARVHAWAACAGILLNPTRALRALLVFLLLAPIWRLDFVSIQTEAPALSMFFGLLPILIPNSNFYGPGRPEWTTRQIVMSQVTTSGLAWLAPAWCSFPACSLWLLLQLRKVTG